MSSLSAYTDNIDWYLYLRFQQGTLDSFHLLTDTTPSEVTGVRFKGPYLKLKGSTLPAVRNQIEVLNAMLKALKSTPGVTATAPAKDSYYA